MNDSVTNYSFLQKLQQWYDTLKASFHFKQIEIWVTFCVPNQVCSMDSIIGNIASCLSE